MLATDQLSYSYPAGGPTVTLPNLTLPPGGQTLVLGASGSGKSTLLSLLGGLLTPTSGRIQLDDTAVHELRGAKRDGWRGRHVGIVYQRPRLLGTQTVAANIALPLRLLGEPAAFAKTRDALAELDLGHLANRLPRQCSQGEQQRIGILRALVHSPALILADEPTSALDERNALRVAELLSGEARRRGATLIVVTHDHRIAPLFPRSLNLDVS